MPDENDIVYNTYGVNPVSFVRSLFEAVRDFFRVGDGGVSSFFDSLGAWWEIYSLIALFLSALFVWGFMYARIRYAQLAEIEAAQFEEAVEAWRHAYGGGVSQNSRWDDVLAHSSSENPNDWRLAIIEADIMLEQVLDDAGYVGASVGDKLKTANETSFQTVRDAWDAHMVRNKIAHAGSDFVLTKRIMQETIVKYERVFREFNAI